MCNALFKKCALKRTLNFISIENRIQFRTKPSNVRVTIGQQARLKCRVRGGSAAITWLKDGTPLTKSTILLFNSTIYINIIVFNKNLPFDDIRYKRVFYSQGIFPQSCQAALSTLFSSFEYC